MHTYIMYVRIDNKIETRKATTATNTTRAFYSIPVLQTTIESVLFFSCVLVRVRLKKQTTNYFTVIYIKYLNLRKDNIINQTIESKTIEKKSLLELEFIVNDMRF